jgi:hypothetical protein
MFLNDFPVPEPISAMRMVFECENQQMRLVAQVPVAMPVITSDISRTEAGYYVDTRDSSGTTLARVPAYNVFPTSVEVFPENSDEFMARYDRPACNSAFTVVVPVQNETDHITILQVSPIEGDGLTKNGNLSEHQKMKSTELASFKLLNVR